MKLHFVVLLFLFAVMFFSPSCKSKKQNSDTTVTEPKVEQPMLEKKPVIAKRSVETEQKQPASKVIVLVNRTKITEEQLKNKIAENLDKVQEQMPESLHKRFLEELRKKLLDQMITEVLLDEQVKANEIKVSDQELEQHIQWMNAARNMQMSDFLKLLEAKGQTLDDYKLKTRKELTYEKLMKQKLGHMLNITEQDARSYYSVHLDEFQKNGKAIEFEQAKDLIIQKLTKKKQKRFAAGYIEELKQEAKIVYPATDK